MDFSRTLSVESKCAELLANYCDLLLRKTQLSKKLTSEEIDEKLNQVLLVLKYVENKDVFMRFHRAHLSRRLILEMSADQEKEEMMVTKLRECGMPSDAVNKLSRMLQDIELNKVSINLTSLKNGTLSQDLNTSFKKSIIGTNNNKSVSGKECVIASYAFRFVFRFDQSKSSQRRSLGARWLRKDTFLTSKGARRLRARG